jgi:two-component system, OmpR family, sensor histidine kinase ChvG
MALDTVTATDKASHSVVAGPALDAAETKEFADTREAHRHAGLSPLTRRILAVNIIALAILGVGLLQLGDYQRSLVEAQLAALKTQARVLAAALGESAVSDTGGGVVLIQDFSRQMIRRLVEPTRDRARLFDPEGRLVIDTRALQALGGVQISELPPPGSSNVFGRGAVAVYRFVERLLPQRYPNAEDLPIDQPGNYPEVKLALDGDIADAVRRTADNGLVLSVAVPIQHYRQVLGALLLSSDNGEVEEAVRDVRFTIVQAFAIAFVITVLLAIYLAGTIARPIRRLADAAERVRRGHGLEVQIPDFTNRRDEIGDLSGSLRDMTAALWQRMDAIERFAADVAHELKNPLGSVRSAIETAARVTDPAKQQKLLALVLEDIERLTRLINDISEASRLDAELSRTAMTRVYIGRVLAAMVEIEHATAGDHKKPKLELSLPGPRGSTIGDLAVLGHEDRLVQVFRNLLSNAISFTPAGGTIRIAASRQSGYVVVTVDDDGPGIPESKLKAIFERFYSERPEGEKFGMHSGLGLSISKQIVEGHRGTIAAENRRRRDGTVAGARFTVRLRAA